MCFCHHSVFLSSQCVSVITMCFCVFPSLQCISVIKLCFRHHSVFPSPPCVSVIKMCFCHQSVYSSSHCVSVITVCFRHHSGFPSSQCILYFSMGVSNGRFPPCSTFKFEVKRFFSSFNNGIPTVYSHFYCISLKNVYGYF